MTTEVNPERIDARGQVLGRLATQIATKLIGKDRRDYRPGQFIERPIVVTNASHIVVTGRKREQKVYHRHTGYPGGLRTRSFEDQFALDPTAILRHAVRGMLPKNRLQQPRLNQLTILRDEES